MICFAVKLIGAGLGVKVCKVLMEVLVSRTPEVSFGQKNAPKADKHKHMQTQGPE
ncbi:hypothetical protein BY996DRAFT_6604507 [Phakopsora pachyrhizi]|nr:hypothetical protein BY996DRAFT_6604507 [Phakopsora pachyrhizi]